MVYTGFLGFRCATDRISLLLSNDQVCSKDLVEGLEEAAYLAWLHVHVWWENNSGGVIETASIAEDDLVLVAG